MGRERKRLSCWTVIVLVVFFSGVHSGQLLAVIPEKDVDKRNTTQAGEFLDSAALAILVGGSGPQTAAELAAQAAPKTTTSSKPEPDSLSGLLEGAYPASDEESLRWKDAEETPAAELDPADGDIDPFSDGLSVPETSLNPDQMQENPSSAPEADSPLN